MTSLRHLLKISDWSRDQVLRIVDGARLVKASPQRYSSRLSQRTLVMLFEKPSLRTRISFEVAMTQLGGHAIFYSIADSPLGKKETFEDTARVLSRYADAVMARLKCRQHIRELAKFSAVPVINALDDFAHPCQVLADLQTIVEHRTLRECTMTYLGDIANNVTYDLMRAAALIGFHIRVCGPAHEDFKIEQNVIDECDALIEDARLHGHPVGSIQVFNDPREAVHGANVVYTDSWMSYHIDKVKMDARLSALDPYRVTEELMQLAADDVIFMHCLPAQRGAEVSASVIDDRSKSVVFDQAENRLHAQKAVLLDLLGKLDN